MVLAVSSSVGGLVGACEELIFAKSCPADVASCTEVIMMVMLVTGGSFVGSDGNKAGYLRFLHSYR